MIKCDICEKAFNRNCDFEKHMDEHEADKNFKCDVCDKTFYPQCRIKKHQGNHTEEGVKQCKFYLSKDICPYENIGCKFLHTKSTEDELENDDLNNMSDQDDDFSQRKTNVTSVESN